MLSFESDCRRTAVGACDRDGGYALGALIQFSAGLEQATKRLVFEMFLAGC